MNLLEIENERESALNDLFTEWQGERTPKHSEAIHAAKVADIDAEYNRQLAALLAEAEAERAEAANLASMQYTDKTTWLSGDELAAANSRAAFVREDLERADIDTQLNMARRALSSGDRPLIWLMARYLPQTAKTGSLSLNGELTAVLRGLEAAIMPAEQAAAGESARQKARAAEEKRVAAKYALWQQNGGLGMFNPFA